jgi:hypothetical protein
LKQATSNSAPHGRGDAAEEVETWTEELADSGDETAPRSERPAARPVMRMEARRRVELYMEERRLRACLADEF